MCTDASRRLCRLVRRATSAAGLAASLACSPGEAVFGPLAPIEALGGALRPERFAVGRFEVAFEGVTSEQARLRVTHASEPARSLWESLPGRAFVGAGRGRESVRESRGSFSVRERILERCGAQRVDTLRRAGDALLVAGRLRCPSGELPYELAFSPAKESEHQLRFELRLLREGFDRIGLRFAAGPDERFFGFGEQFSHLDLTGRRVPILVREQGVGRGRQPLTFLANRIGGAGGDWHTSYAPVPHYLTSRLRSLVLENAEYAVFDLRAPGRVTVQAFADRLAGRILHGRTPLELIAEHTAHAGRMRRLPDWIHQGAVIGMQGGTERVRAAWRELRAREVPVAAFWLQDWVGQRVTSFGRQLWWNWELDRDRYPDWEGLVRELDQAGVRVLTYVNPFLVDVSAKGNARRDLLAEARERDLLVRAPQGGTYWLRNTSFDAALLDLTKPEAWDWFKGVLKQELLAPGASGWMADFGEALPWDAVLASGESAARVHNRYPELWAQLNREAIEEAGRGEDAVFFTRSGFTQSPRFSTLFWLGDQLVTWDRHDGMRSALTGLLSGGLSGFALNHGDVGGYTTLVTPLLTYRRTKELFLRWAELAAFQVVFRTHEGNLPEANHQFDADEETLRHFARMAKLHAAWGFYRRALVREASERGLPVARPLFLHHPDDPEVWALPATQFLLGSQLLVAPVLDPGRATVRVYLPAGRWVHLWSGCVLQASGRGTKPRSGGWLTVRAPLGEPAVLFRERSPVGAELRRRLAAGGLLAAARPPCPREFDRAR